jgi:superfamily II DNA or RNA helicase
MDYATSVARMKAEPQLPGLDTAAKASAPDTRERWMEMLSPALTELSPESHKIAETAIRALPWDPALLLMAALAALVAGQPDRAMSLLKRFEKKFEADRAVTLLTAFALARQGYVARAWALLDQNQLLDPRAAMAWFIGGRPMTGWLVDELMRVRKAYDQHRRVGSASASAHLSGRKAPGVKPPAAQPQPQKLPRREFVASKAKLAAKPADAAHDDAIDLPRLDIALDLAFELVSPDAIQLSGATSEPAWFALRAELIKLGLVEGFDELLCLSALRGVEAHWHQIETVRKVLKQYRGRVLLADEVGLGKTIEAGMILKEYLLRGMAERILILVPAPLVGQWREEMAGKFGIECATTHDALLRQDPAAFWAQPRIVASMATARRRDHASVLEAGTYDVVVVDEAHHLRDQASASYRLVNALQKRYLLLLSATPVQNNLIELYNLLTLLQPGIFRTQKDFRAAYMVPGKPREPANRDRLRDLMRGAMVRNTRALAAVRLPRRHASTIRAVPDAEEAQCYTDLTNLARMAAAAGKASQARLAVQHLLGAAGSSPAAAAAAIARFAERHPQEHGWIKLQARYQAVQAGAKQAALLKLLAQNPAEKKMVFIHHRDSMTQLAALLKKQGLSPLMFDGSMSGPEKDASVAAFRDTGNLLLCSESGGEGRNLQFCNTLINFDIPWNPMAIEQRIGRIDRIGQTREVFVFNLVTAGTIEDEMLRILDEKLNMFELVVGEVGAILGEIEEDQDFPSLVLDAWLQSTDEARAQAFAALETQMTAARRQYEETKELDEKLFGSDLDAA